MTRIMMILLQSVVGKEPSIQFKTKMKKIFIKNVSCTNGRVWIHGCKAIKSASIWLGPMEVYYNYTDYHMAAIPNKPYNSIPRDGWNRNTTPHQIMNLEVLDLER